MNFEQWLQGRLTAHGFACGLIDGVLGPKTFHALRSFQKARGLIVTSRADEATVTALKTPSSRVSFEESGFIPDRDIDDDVAEIVSPWPRQKDVSGFFGAVGTGQTHIDVPWDMRLAWDIDVPVRRISIHSKAAASATQALNKIRKIYSDREIKNLGLDHYGGSLNVRRTRGGSRYSMHSWGIAIDFDPERNQLSWKSPRARLSHDDAIPFWRAWEDEGWTSLGRARNFDWMHVQAARL